MRLQAPTAPRTPQLLAARLLAALTLLALAAGGVPARTAASAKATDGRVTVTLMHINDFHAQLMPAGKYGGAAAMAAAIKRVKAERPGALALSAGDQVQGTPVSTIFGPKPIFDVLDACGIDAATLGNHEFDAGYEMADILEAADFPVVCANILRDGRPVADAPWVILNAGGVRVGVIGVTTNSSIDREGLTIRDPAEVLRKLIPEVDRQAQLVVVLSHLGLPEDRELARAVGGIDVIVGGHSHSVLKAPERVGRTLIVQAGKSGRYVGRLDVRLNPASEEVTAWHSSLIDIPARGLVSDPLVARAVNQWEKLVKDKVDIPLGRTPRGLNQKQLRERVERIWRETYKTDLAWTNSGSIRKMLPAGPIQVRDIYEMMPFDNKLVILELTRDQATAAVREARLTQNKTLYTLITTDYDARRLIARFRLGGERVRNLPDNWREPVITWVRRHGSLEQEDTGARKTFAK